MALAILRLPSLDRGSNRVAREATSPEFELQERMGELAQLTYKIKKAANASTVITYELTPGIVLHRQSYPCSP